MNKAEFKRRPARVVAMQVLYAMRMSTSRLGEALEAVLNSYKVHKKQQEYAIKLIDLVQANEAKLDQWIGEGNEKWAVTRMPPLDRAILHVALCELAYIPDVPPKIVIKEASQISRKYSTQDSGRFVNGILHRFAIDNKIMEASDDAE
jgi:N utilization substance protein B